MPLAVAAQEEGYVPRFRPGHSLSFFGLVQRNDWKIDSVGFVSDARVVDYSFVASLRYAFHVNLVGQFGLLLGSSLGAEFGNARIAGFASGSAVRFPSLNFGLVQALKNRNRVSLNVETSANWYPAMKSIDANGQNIVIGPIPDRISVFSQYDVFTDRDQAISIVFGAQRVCSLCFCRLSESDTAVNRISFSNFSVYLGAGLSWNFEEDLNL